MKIKKILPLGVAIVGVGAGLFVWQHTQKSQPAPNNSLQKVTLAMDWTPNTNHTGVYVAIAKGWYKSHGIDLEILPYSASVTATSLVSNSKADVGVGSMEDIVAENAKNHPVVSIAALTAHNTSGLIVRADAGINSPKDLDGKVYGGYGTAMEGPVISQVIKKAGGEGKFENVTLNVGAMEALGSKKIDFVWVFEGWEVIQAKREGSQTKFFPIIDYGIPDATNLAFIATSHNVQQKADALKKFMAATAEGYEYARSNPKEAAQLLINATPKETFPDKNLVYDSQIFLSTKYADKGQKWGVQNIKQWTDYPQFMLASGAVKDENDKPVASLAYEKLFTNRFIDQ